MEGDPKTNNGPLSRPSFQGQFWGVLCVAAILFVFIFPFIVQRFRPPMYRPPQSLSYIKQCDLSAIMYQNDYDGLYPRSDKWVDRLVEYSKTEAVFHDPALQEPSEYGFAFRDKASNVKDVDIAEPVKFIVIFTSDIKSRNAHGELGSMPANGRYGGDNVIAFADGHAKNVHGISTVPGNKPDWLVDDSKAGPKVANLLPR